MKDYNIKQKISNNKGITLISLIITVVLIIIITGVSINIGIDSLESTRLSGFYTQLEMVQKRVDDIATSNENYVDSNGNIAYLKEQGTAYSNLTSDKQTELRNIILNESEGLISNIEKFRYFTVEEIENILDVSEIEYNMFIEFDTRTIIAEDGIIVNGKSHHILKNKIYFVQHNQNKNEGQISSLKYNIINYGTGRYKITVEPSNIVGDLEKSGTLKYKKVTSKYWETSNNLDMIITGITEANFEYKYNVEYVDRNNNSISQIISVVIDEAKNPTVTVVTE